MVPFTPLGVDHVEGCSGRKKERPAAPTIDRPSKAVDANGAAPMGLVAPSAPIILIAARPDPRAKSVQQGRR